MLVTNGRSPGLWRDLPAAFPGDGARVGFCVPLPRVPAAGLGIASGSIWVQEPEQRPSSEPWLRVLLEAGISLYVCARLHCCFGDAASCWCGTQPH